MSGREMIAPERDIDETLEQIAMRAAALAGTENALVLLLNADGEDFTVKAGTGACAGFVGQTFPARVGMNGEILAAIFRSRATAARAPLLPSNCPSSSSRVGQRLKKTGCKGKPPRFGRGGFSLY